MNKANLNLKLILILIVFQMFTHIGNAQRNGWYELGGGGNCLSPRGSVNAMAMDSRNLLYAAGNFKDSRSVPVVYAWDGNVWTSLPNGNYIFSTIYSMVTDLHNNLYTNGYIPDTPNANDIISVIKWNGHSWSNVGGAVPGLSDNSYGLNLCRDKRGNIYAAGSFTNSVWNYTTISPSANYLNVIKWNDTSWVPLGVGPSGLNAQGYDIVITSDTFGNIYAGGDFKDPQGYYYIAKWNGQNWSELGTGANALQGTNIINTICTDSKANVYTFSSYSVISKWNGSSWSNYATAPLRNPISSIFIDSHDFLYATVLDTLGANIVLKWTGTGWTYLQRMANTRNVLSATKLVEDNQGHLYTGAGGFKDETNTSFISEWNGSAWEELGTGSGALNGGINTISVNGEVHSITAVGPNEVYVSGNFQDYRRSEYVAKWNGSKWVNLGIGFDSLGFIGAPLSHDVHGNIYTATTQRSAGGYRVVKWDGSTWSSVGTDTGYMFRNILNLISITNDSAGNLYLSGNFNDSLGSCIYKWDGSSWSILGGSGIPLSIINHVTIDRTGKIFAWGNSATRHDIWKWDGNRWDTIPSYRIGGYYLYPNYKYSMVNDDFGNLYIGGNFGTANYFLKFDGQSWSVINALGANPRVDVLCRSKSGNIYATGGYVNGHTERYVAKYDGQNWSKVDTNTINLYPLSNYGSGYQITCLETDPEENIYVGGQLLDSFQLTFIGRYGTAPYHPLSIVSLPADIDFNLYPNPNKGIFTIKSNGNTNARATVMDITGRIVSASVIINDSSTQLDVSHCLRGIYLVKLELTDGSIIVKKFVKE